MHKALNQRCDQEQGHWVMHDIGLFDLNRELKQRLRHKFSEENGMVRLLTTLNGPMDMLNIILREEHLQQTLL